MSIPPHDADEAARFRGTGPIHVDQQLALGDGAERLPWLESDDDFEQPGLDTGRILAFAVLALLALVVLAGGIYWWMRDDSGQELVADGSVIEAPDEPYRTRPDEPGGRLVDGTGATSFEVAEGVAVDSRIAGSGTVPAPPSIDRDQPGGEDEPSVAPSGVGVQVGAYFNRAQAEAGWSQLVARFEILQGRSHRVLEGIADSGTVFRLQAVAGSLEDAQDLCGAIKADGGDCQVKR